MTARRRRLYVVPAPPKWELGTCAHCHQPMHLLGDGNDKHPTCDPPLPPLVSEGTQAARAGIRAAIRRQPKESA